jgi:hypothetical protein
MSNAHIEQICRALSVGLDDSVTPAMLAPAWFQPTTVAAIDAIPASKWKLAPEDSYCPVTFGTEFGVPEGLCWERSYIETPDAVFAAGSNGDWMFYFKFVRA